MAALSIALVSVADHIDSVSALLAENWQESGLAEDGLAISPDLEAYRLLDAAGSLFCLAVLDDAGEIVGYSMNLVTRHAHASSLVFCANDVIFIRRGNRHSRAGLLLIRATEDEARRRGATLMVWGAKPETAFAALIDRLGYRPREISFVKTL